MVQAGHEVIVATRRSYVLKRENEWHGVRLVHLPTPDSKSLEAIVHTFLAVLKARSLQSDVIHIHSIGPGLMVPFARLLGLRVVVTNHGPDYNRQKWGRFAGAMLRMGEYLGGKYAHQVIAISSIIADIIKKRCGREVNLIYNGVPVPQKSDKTDFLKSREIRPGTYILAVARFVPEKGLHNLLSAFSRIQGNYQLVIAGDADHETEYSHRLKAMAARDERVRLVGYITGEDLNQVFSHAGLFCLPSYHEGLPIALLEAMSYELPVLVSDIPANKEVNLPEGCYFHCRNEEELRQKLQQFLEQCPRYSCCDYGAQLQGKYNWKTIARQTVRVYEKALKCSGSELI